MEKDIFLELLTCFKETSLKNSFYFTGGNALRFVYGSPYIAMALL